MAQRKVMPAAGGSTDAIGNMAAISDAVFQIEGAWTGTIFFECRTDGGLYVPLSVTPAAGGAAVTQLAAGETGIWRTLNGGASGVEARARFVPGTGTPTIASQAVDW